MTTTEEQAVATIGHHMGLLLSTLRGAARRVDTGAVLLMYREILGAASRCRVVDPASHAQLIYHLSYGQGVVFVPKRVVHTMRGRLELGERVEWDGEHTALDSFDPRRHAILFHEPCAASYMEGNPGAS